MQEYALYYLTQFWEPPPCTAVPAPGGSNAYPIPVDREQTREFAIATGGEAWIQCAPVITLDTWIYVGKIFAASPALTIQIFGENYVGTPITTIGPLIGVRMPSQTWGGRGWVRVTDATSGDRLSVAWVQQ